MATLAQLTAGGKGALARALARIEEAPDSSDIITLLSEAYAMPIGVVVGVTGPPGVGKSSLLSVLIRTWRQGGRTVGCIAVDPSSRRTGGALLGDRVHLATDPDDQGVFIRSMAARDRLGGLAELTVSAMVLMRALFDVVVIETVGVGQSETDVAAVADAVVFCVQPGSGDSLQFMKAGIAEIPDIVAVTKADVGMAAARAQADVADALHLTQADRSVPVLLVSSRAGTGVAELVAAIDTHIAAASLAARRAAQAEVWLGAAVRERFGREGLRCLGGTVELGPGLSPFHHLAELTQRLSR